MLVLLALLLSLLLLVSLVFVLNPFCKSMYSFISPYFVFSLLCHRSTVTFSAFNFALFHFCDCRF